MVPKIADSIRYSEKKLLSRYDLYIDLFKRFNLKVTDVVPVRNVFIIFTDKGKKILKKVEYSKENLFFIDEAINYITKTFPRVMSFTKTMEGEIYTEWNGELYCILDLVEGRECEFSNPLDVSIASKGIAQLHKASEGYKTSMQDKCMVGKAIDVFERKYDELKFFKRLVSLHENKSDFDKIFLQNIDFYLRQITYATKLLSNSAYFRICSEEDKVAVCHHDLAYHNILVNNDEAYFIDFDYAVLDIKVHDLCNFINKAIKNVAFDLEKGKKIIEDYCTFNTIDKREAEVLYALLTFPEEFYSISKDYYGRRKEWEEETFVDRFIRKLDYKEDREEFLKGFGEYIQNNKFS